MTASLMLNVVDPSFSESQSVKSCAYRARSLKEAQNSLFPKPRVVCLFTGAAVDRNVQYADFKGE